MSTRNPVYPKFERALCHPRYLLTWCGILLFYLMMLLPYHWLSVIGRHLGKLVMLLLKKRVNIARRNLELCFPAMSKAEIEQWIIKNFESVGMGLVETGMAWFWPSWRIHHWCKIKGLEHITQAQQQGKGILLIGLHFLTLELGARVFGEYNPSIGVYRPHNNKLMDWLQTWGRLRSNKYMLNRKNVRGMIFALKKGEIVWYAPDHDYGPRNSVFVPLFAVEQAATTVGTYILARNSHPEIIPFTAIRADDENGYTIVIQPPVKNFPLDNKIDAAYTMNKVVEQEILRAPTQYMWMHRRFKTRPENINSLY